MPTYRYRCTQCGEEFELWQSITDEAIHTHDEGCGGEVLKVLIPAGIVLKGSGFYKTDSRSADSKRKDSGDHKPKDTDGKDGSATKESGPSDTSSDKPSESGSGGTGDTKPSTTKTGESKSTAGAAKPT
ncbi:MAG TPA: FmdB family zinc ribbon protein [Acidimicrobiia bacterium]|nr:FmdB family zinc ribbon protein [Acidimicrobiia bacterium]